MTKCMHFFFREEDLSFDSNISRCIDFSVESQMLSSSDINSSMGTSINPTLGNRHLSSIKPDESSFATAALLQSTDGMQSSYIQTMNDSLNVNGYQEEIEQENNMRFLTADGAFHLPFSASSENNSFTNLGLHGSENIPSHTSTQSQLLDYSVVSSNQPCSYQPLQFSSAPVAASYSTLGRVLTCNNEQSTFPNLLNSFLRYQSHAPAEPIASRASTSESVCDFRSARSSKFLRVTKRQAPRQNKPRGDGNKLLSTRATYVLEGWYEANTDWPYPSKAEKQVMASAGGITIEQVKLNFFPFRSEWQFLLVVFTSITRFL